MGIKEIFDRIRERMKERRMELDNRDDNETTDKYLRSLRRESRIIDEKKEKLRLIKKIKLERKRELVEELFGQYNALQEKKKMQPVKKDMSFLSNSNMIEQNKMFKKGKGGMI